MGVFPLVTPKGLRWLGLPHACGGVSVTVTVESIGGRSSPRVWGCFFISSRPVPQEVVFPTRVGVFLTKAGDRLTIRRLPHACGGVSTVLTSFLDLATSSPRVWGCFSGQNHIMFGLSVFPTRVGVFLLKTGLSLLHKSLPHACGGVSCASGLGP